MQKYIAQSVADTRQCADARSAMWGDQWTAKHELSRCDAREYRNDRYSDPYYYEPPWGRPTLATTPALSKQFTAGVCGVNQAKEYRERMSQYQACLAAGSKDCERQFGCPNPNGEEFKWTEPKDPLYTDCVPCWRYQ